MLEERTEAGVEAAVALADEFATAAAGVNTLNAVIACSSLLGSLWHECLWPQLAKKGAALSEESAFKEYVRIIVAEIGAAARKPPPAQRH